MQVCAFETHQHLRLSIRVVLLRQRSLWIIFTKSNLYSFGFFCCNYSSSSPSAFSTSIGFRQVPQTNGASGFAQAFNPQEGQVYFVLLAAFFLRSLSFSLRSE